MSAAGFLGPTLVVRGRLRVENDLDLEVSGKFEGQLQAAGAVHVGPEGLVRASLDVRQLVIQGTVRGPVHASESVVIRSGGQLVGDVRAPSVGIDDGGALHGGIEMDFDVPDELPPKT